MKLTIYRKMMMGFGLVIIVMIGVIAILLFELNAFSSVVTSTLSVNTRSIDLARQLQVALDDEERHAQKFLISRDTAYALLFTEAARGFGRGVDSLASMVWDRWTLWPVRSERRSRLASLVHLETGLLGAGHDRFASYVLQEASHIAAGRVPADPAMDEAVADTVQVLRDRLDKLIRANQEAVAASVGELQETTERAVALSILLTFCTVAGTVLLAFLIARTITQPIRILRAGTERIAQGRFEPITVSSHDEIAALATAFNVMSKKLRQINEYKADMMHHITHDLRLPLQSMHSIYYLLTEQIHGPINDRQRELLGTLRENIDRIAGFSNQFLDLARIEAGMMQYRRELVDLASLVQPVVESARPMATKKEVKLVVAVRETRLKADPEKISQVISNLLNNAIKYTEKGGTVTVAVEPLHHGGRLSVSDTGVGIDAQDLPHLFTKFFQARNVGKASGQGTGIGLALVKGIVDGHGGTISVRSVVGKGSTFAVELPASGEPRPRRVGLRRGTAVEE